ncbi:hypothetical protein BLNAU_3267 [Blattamonas nauphoetae]|uniref:Uncharacterized protein n=1 Tax=Blattamonas nauphoetae TaxID=2049346 RepID=A0ABQ9YDP0_9EUKA|nr:hypothetical protein BLNAU_3267 [Blattamonas nauphoetae]
MGNKPSRSNTISEACIHPSPESKPIIQKVPVSLLTFEANSELSLEDELSLFDSLVVLVKENSPLHHPLQDNAVQLLESLKSKWDQTDRVANRRTDLISNSTGSPSDFLESIFTLLSSPHLRVVAAALSLLYQITSQTSTEMHLRLVETDFIGNILTHVHQHTQQIAGNDTILCSLLGILEVILFIAQPIVFREIGVITPFDAFNHRDLIFQEVISPSSPFLHHLCRNVFFLSRSLSHSFLRLLDTLLHLSPFHRATLEFVLAAPIVMAFASCLSLVEEWNPLRASLRSISRSLKEWKEQPANHLSQVKYWEGYTHPFEHMFRSASRNEWKHEVPDAQRSGKQILAVLISEGFEDTLDEMLMHEKGRLHDLAVFNECRDLSRWLGSNVADDWTLHSPLLSNHFLVPLFVIVG